MLEEIRARGCSKENSEHVCMHRLVANNSFISTSDIHRWEYHLVYQRSRVSLPIWSCQSHAEQRKRRQTTFAIFVWSSGPGNLLRSHGSCSPSQVHPSTLRPYDPYHPPHAQPPQRTSEAANEACNLPISSRLASSCTRCSASSCDKR